MGDDTGAKDYKTLRVPETAWEVAREQKEAAGRTWGEQIVRPGVDGEEVATDTSVDDVTVAMPDYGDRFDRLAELVERVPDRTADELERRLR